MIDKDVWQEKIFVTFLHFFVNFVAVVLIYGFGRWIIFLKIQIVSNVYIFLVIILFATQVADNYKLNNSMYVVNGVDMSNKQNGGIIPR